MCNGLDDMLRLYVVAVHAPLEALLGLADSLVPLDVAVKVGINGLALFHSSKREAQLV